jgi:hypothetical protein
MKKFFIYVSILLCASCNQKNAQNTTTNTSEAATPTTENGDHNHPKISDMISNPATANEPQVDPKKAAIIEFSEKLYQFGRIKAGTIVTHEFKFKNTGKNPLVIKDAVASCGCTVAEFPKEPIPVGGTGSIIAKFNSEGRNSMQAKYITVYANTIPGETKLAMEGDVYAE